MKKHRIFCAGILAVAAIVASPASVFAEDIQWSKYMTSSAIVSAIASALAQVDSCSEPVAVEEQRVGGKLQLSFTCSANEDEEATSVIEFEQFGDGILVPGRFYFAG
jgi:hypothetical protein